MKILKWIGSLFLPMFSRPRVSPGVVWFLHLLLVAGIAVGLYFLQSKTQYFDRLIGYGPVWFRPFWLPALFLLAYFVAWQIWWVLKLLRPEAIESYFPDLDDAWNQVLESLNKAGIGIGDTAVYLVFGRVVGADEAMFQSVPGGLAVTGATPTGSAVRAFANRDAIFVTCPGASMLGNPGQVQQVAAPGGGMSLTESIGANAGMLGASIGIGASVGMSAGAAGGDVNRVQNIIRAARDQNRSLSDAERNEIRRLSEGGGAQQAAPKGGGTTATLMQDPAEVEYRQMRLTHLCGLIARSRWPLCPINGAIVYVSVEDCEKEEVAQQIGLIARQDVRTAEDSMRLQFPVFSLIGGLETLPGGPEFLLKFAADRKGQRLGKGFPLSPDSPPEAVGTQAESAAQWVFHSLLPYWVFKLFGVERGTEGPDGATRQNSELFQFLNAVRVRGRAVARLIGRLATPSESGLIRFGGVYLTANSPELGTGPLFLDEFYKKAAGTQAFVEWTDAAFTDDARYRRNTKLGYIALFVIVVALLAFGGFVATQNPKA